MSQAIAIQPIPEESYEGRQWGYLITLNGEPVLHAAMGGTGSCWNLDGLQGEGTFGPLGHVDVHACELDDLIRVLVALRRSDVDRENTECWGETWRPLDLSQDTCSQTENPGVSVASDESGGT